MAFKPMVKMMTTEPSVELKLKKGGHVAKQHDKSGHKMMDGGVMRALSASPVGVRGGNLPAARPTAPSMMARRKAMMGMAGGGESKAEHKAEMSKMKGLEKELKSHESKPASKAHKGLKTGGVAMGQGGFKKGGKIVSESTRGDYKSTEVHEAKPDRSPKKTGEVKMGAAGYKKGGSPKYAKGGGVENNISTSKPGVTNTTTGEVKKGQGGYKKGGAAKKAFATGGLVDSGRPVAYPKKPASKPVSNDRQSGTFKKGGKVKMADGGLVDLSKGAYDKSMGPSEEEMDMAKTIRALPGKMYEGVKGLFTPKSVTKTKESVTVSKRKGGEC